MGLTPPRLELEHVSRVYDGQRVVDDVSLSLAPGQVTCLLGPSGCGKSTTLRIAAGVEGPSSGVVRIDGQVVADGTLTLPPEQRNVGLMFQDFALFPHLDVAGNIAFGLSVPKAEKAARVRDLLTRVGLTGYERKYPHQLSGGEQQRVALARALAPRPRVLLMDEPFSGLDNRLRDDVRDATLDILKEEGTAVLLVTHEPEEAMRMADQIALMRAGRIVQVGAPYNIYNTPVDKDAAGFFSDINVLHSSVKDRQASTPFGRFLTPGLVDDADVEIIFRPQHLHLDFDRKDGPPRETPERGSPARGHVLRARFIGNQSLVEFEMEQDRSVIRATIPGVFLPPKGTPLWLSLRRDRCFVFPCAHQTKVSSPFERDYPPHSA
ncbi:iron(III) transport system ATP-binding protein [Rubricella aquisinus]|uniref:Iron(III) transport system ATP-binding protein n=1 Tax=Rubricella aquisinus TaxID=2028108 RepID=A0A840WKW3_9RHOB|nr:ABC transporter ATP-binding protein [Rubricella aquisinus]MBB5515699.1 iron(III) transport system ATP-binding protein [Rubricella aquisinus]